jgi:hypothetical protein
MGYQDELNDGVEAKDLDIVEEDESVDVEQVREDAAREAEDARENANELQAARDEELEAQARWTSLEEYQGRYEPGVAPNDIDVEPFRRFLEACGELVEATLDNTQANTIAVRVTQDAVRQLKTRLPRGKMLDDQFKVTFNRVRGDAGL